MTSYIINYIIFLICMFLRLTQGSGEVKAVGCLLRSDNSKDFQTQILKMQFDWGERLTVQTCVKHCWINRFKFAGIQGGKKCYCSMSAKDTVKVPEMDCDARCEGNCNQNCGGEKAISAYKTGYIREPIFALDKDKMLKARIGCYTVSKSLRILCPRDMAPLATYRLTAPMCIFYCDAIHKAKFATVHLKSECCCSNTVTNARTTKLEMCSWPCMGDPSFKACKGLRVMSTFQISRLPTFKRWPKSYFQGSNQLEPQFPEGEKFEIKKSDRMGGMDASLSGLLAKKGEKVMVGQDKREPVSENLQKSVDVVPVEEKTEPAKVEEAEEEGNGTIIAAVVVGFIIFVAAAGFYMFKRKKVLEEHAEQEKLEQDEEKAGESTEPETETETETEPDSESEAKTTTDDSEEEEKSKRKKKEEEEEEKEKEKEEKEEQK